MMSARKCLLAVLLAASTLVHAQAPAVGRLLVSTPSLDDPSFSESVLLILLHEDGSSAGILLNRPTWVEPTEAYPAISGLEGYGDALFLGGPAAPDQMLTLFEHDGVPPAGATRIFGDVHFSPLPEILNEIDFASEEAPRVRVYAGYAEWGPGQLEQEIAAGHWRLMTAQAEHVFSDDPSSLWSRLPGAGDSVTASLD